jgi:hypothetical protein
MTRHYPAWTSFLMSALIPVWLLATPSTTWAAPQHGGGGHSSGGGGGSHSSGGGAHSSGGGGSHGQSAGQATARGDSGGARATAPTSGPSSAGNQAGSSATGPHATARGGETTGKAVPRGTVPPAGGGGGGVVIVPGYGYGFYPWGFGGLGFAGAYYGGFYDPWDGVGSYPAYPIVGGYSSDDQGAVRLKVKPREAQVYVDGYYAGTVDDFDGVFQRLHLRSGSHHIEIRAPGYETLTVDVDIQTDHTISYEGELKRIQ